MELSLAVYTLHTAQLKKKKILERTKVGFMVCFLRPPLTSLLRTGLKVCTTEKLRAHRGQMWVLL